MIVNKTHYSNIYNQCHHYPKWPIQVIISLGEYSVSTHTVWPQCLPTSIEDFERTHIEIFMIVCNLIKPGWLLPYRLELSLAMWIISMSPELLKLLTWSLLKLLGSVLPSAHHVLYQSSSRILAL